MNFPLKEKTVKLLPMKRLNNYAYFYPGNDHPCINEKMSVQDQKQFNYSSIYFS